MRLLQQHGWFRWMVIGLCAVGLSASGACKPAAKNPKVAGAGATRDKKKAGGKESGTDGKQGEGKTAGGKQGAGKKGGGKGGGKGGKGGGKGSKGGAKDGKGEAKNGKGGAKPGPGGAKTESGVAPKAATLVGIAFTVPKDWKASAVKSADENIQASYELPRKEGVQDTFTLLVRLQPEVKGKAKESIVQRYAKMKPLAGAKEVGPTITEETTAEGIKLTLGDMVGTMEGRKTDDKEGGQAATMRMMTAVIEDAKGPHTVHISASQGVIDGSADVILGFIRSVKPQS